MHFVAVCCLAHVLHSSYHLSCPASRKPSRAARCSASSTPPSGSRSAARCSRSSASRSGVLLTRLGATAHAHQAHELEARAVRAGAVRTASGCGARAEHIPCTRYVRPRSGRRTLFRILQPIDAHTEILPRFRFPSSPFLFVLSTHAHVDTFFSLEEEGRVRHKSIVYRK